MYAIQSWAAMCILLINHAKNIKNKYELTYNDTLRFCLFRGLGNPVAFIIVIIRALDCCSWHVTYSDAMFSSLSWLADGMYICIWLDKESKVWNWKKLTSYHCKTMENWQGKLGKTWTNHIQCLPVIFTHVSILVSNDILSAPTRVLNLSLLVTHRHLHILV